MSLAAIEYLRPIADLMRHGIGRQEIGLVELLPGRRNLAASMTVFTSIDGLISNPKYLV